jgi:hypothetical protein
MRDTLLTQAAVAATALLLFGTPVLSQAQPQQSQAPAQPPASAPPAPYKAVTITLPQPLDDPSFEAFRKQLADIAQRKDRAALARLVAQNFFWLPQNLDVADKKKPGIDNLSKAMGLEGKDAPGWESLASFAGEPTAEPDSQHQGVMCAPADPVFDVKAAEALAAETKTDPSEWGYPAADGVEVRSTPQASAPVIEKLGLHLVRVYPDDSPLNAVHAEFVRVVTPSGKAGYVPVDAILPLATDQVCYVKEAGGWRIAGIYGGAAADAQ